MDYLARCWLLPTGGLLIAIYAGWVMPARLRDAELEGVSERAAKAWTLLTRWVTPVLVVLVLAHKLGLVDVDESRR